MYLKRSDFTRRLEIEIQKRIPVLSAWKFVYGARRAGAIVDILATAMFNGQGYRFSIEARSAGYPQYIRDGILKLKMYTAHDRSCYPIIAAPLLTEQGKNICREYNVGYFDLGGSAYISCGGIYINTEGNERIKEAMPLTQSIFSPKASRITKMFLEKPDIKWSQKEISQHTELSKGLVSRIISRMSAAGYIAFKDKKLSLANFDDLLSAFTDSEIKRREKKKNYYIWAQNPKRLMASLADDLSKNNISYAFTQEAGASLVAPFASFEIVTVYVESLDKFSEKVVSASSAERGFNLTVIEAPDKFIVTRTQRKQGMNVVDNIQLYADLKKNPLRGEKQAGLILKLIKEQHQ
jgi:hypothetical protein